MDLKLSITVFKKLVKDGHIQPPVFESALYLVGRVGPFCVYAEKKKKGKIYKGTKTKTGSIPYILAGVVGVSMGSSGGKPVVSVEEAVGEVLEFINEYPKEFELRERIKDHLMDPEE